MPPMAARTLDTATPIELPRATKISFDGPVVLFTLLVTVASALLCGIVPAWDRRVGTPARRSKKVAENRHGERPSAPHFGSLVVAHAPAQSC